MGAPHLPMEHLATRALPRAGLDKGASALARFTAITAICIEEPQPLRYCRLDSYDRNHPSIEIVLFRRILHYSTLTGVVEAVVDPLLCLLGRRICTFTRPLLDFHHCQLLTNRVETQAFLAALVIQDAAR